jgi:hypothetical protein
MSSSLLDQALKIYGDREFYDPEKARALYKKGILPPACGRGGYQEQEVLE